ncbi:MAG: hypothetical protein QM485_15810 [Flavobacteriaceae bacterium]
MRKISLVLVAAILLSVGNVMANDSEKKNPPKSLSAQIGEMLNRNNFIFKKSNLVADVRFTLNNAKEIVVLSVDTNDFVLEKFVKGRLNYKKVDLVSYKEGKIYTIPVRVRVL